ncbi:1,4-alpha-glucan branching protein GlgB [Shewanella sedimentimangrovi]|uniref:1,4-alpha-glucan branching enzyme GlgB n=2 Tax=Shewanella sedimentimangrovi TaxID=2814293 RepID=A0ABX7R3Z8_9GAMM|nr:1,4-alpha-glucan branching protein GlgB [Shewanella sedimentimangrovi]QSX38209.1 1,4-alpha-glucan branching protein GlgB [Shewanella sedimentimangrovi]
MTQQAPAFEPSAAHALARGEFIDVFSLLGMHPVTDGLMVRCFLPGAEAVELIGRKDGKKIASLEPCGSEGLFAGLAGRRKQAFPYLLRVRYPLATLDICDPYQFTSLLREDDLYLFSEGRQFNAQGFMGATHSSVDGVEGILFCVWAPNARRVSVVGDFNHWDGRVHVMRRHPANGVWELFIPAARAGDHYKFEIMTEQGECLVKADPYAHAMEGAPNNASLVAPKSRFQWQDEAWMQARLGDQHLKPLSIYEVHLGSWRRKGDNGEHFLSYRELADQLVPHVQQLGFTHIELMPLSEFPFDGSWGYQPVGLYAPTQRFGDADGLRYLVDACHRAGIGVLLDWVVAHFPKDHHGLARFDGTCLYEHEDPRQGSHPDWDTAIFNYGRGEVVSFLISNAAWWLKEFHLDGLRLDAVSSMLYLDYSREEGQWLPNRHGGRENLEAIDFLKLLNQTLYRECPGVMVIAEESTAWPAVSRPIDSGGLGFGFKWNMGWMNDTLDYLGRDPIFRRHHHNQLTFGLMYAFSEQFILSISHDEVVHGKRALLEKIPGDDWQKFATLRAFYGFMWGHPGKKLLFMGAEFGQRDEWNHDRSLDWHLLQYAPHQQLGLWLKDLNRLYRERPCLALTDSSPDGFRWLDCDNAEASVLLFLRRHGDEELLFIINMSPNVYQGFRVGLPRAGLWQELLNSDSEVYGGSNVGNGSGIQAEETPWQDMEYSALVTVPPLACVVLAPEAAIAVSKATPETVSEAMPETRAQTSAKPKAVTKPKTASKSKAETPKAAAKPKAAVKPKAAAKPKTTKGTGA